MLLLTTLVLACVLTVSLATLLFISFRRLKKAKQQSQSLEALLTKERELNQRIQLEQQSLKDQAALDVLTDSLTKLPGRKIFEDRLDFIINQSHRYQLTCGVMFLDIDKFKVINDALGHEIGDLLLKEVADRLRSCIRQVDTIARFSGDEFVFILPQLSKAETAAYVAQRLLDAISQPFEVQGQPLYITASIGISVFPPDGDDTKALVKNAHTAMQQAKSQGRNVYQFYREDMHVNSRRELMLSSDLRSEAMYQEFIIYYQPQINLDTRNITGMVAELVWQHPDFGHIPLEEFSRLAEYSGRINVIGEWLLRSAGQQFLAWKSHGFNPNTISIHVSLSQLENSHFVHKVSNILQELEIEPARLVLEVGEASLAVKIEMVEKTLHMLKHLGVQIAVANFGTKFLSLQHLRHLPVDMLKIDSSIVKDITVNKESAAIANAMIALAKSLQLSIVAEGVEGSKQQKLLKEMGCHVMQGTFFGPPALGKEFYNKTIMDIGANI